MLALLLAGSYLANYINPAYIWPLAFLGLVYPILLMLNIVFVILWVFLRKWLAILSVVVIFAGIGYIGRFFQIQFNRNAVTIDSDIDILSYNVRIFNQYQWEEGPGVGDSIIRYASQRGAELMCFQEYLTIKVNNRFNKYVLDTFLLEYPNQHEYFTYKDDPEWSTGIATFSKLPFTRKGSIHFENSYNSCIYSDVIYGTDTIRIFNVHLQSIKLDDNKRSDNTYSSSKANPQKINKFGNVSKRLKNAFIKRARQVDEVNRLIQLSPYPVIVCGDFNDTPLSYTYHKLRGNLRDAFIDAGKGLSNTYRGNFPSFRIDCIFYSDDFIAAGYQRDQVLFSDHYPISCQLSIK